MFFACATAKTHTGEVPASSSPPKEKTPLMQKHRCPGTGYPMPPSASRISQEAEEKYRFSRHRMSILPCGVSVPVAFPPSASFLLRRNNRTTTFRETHTPSCERPCSAPKVRNAHFVQRPLPLFLNKGAGSFPDDGMTSIPFVLTATIETTRIPFSRKSVREGSPRYPPPGYLLRACKNFSTLPFLNTIFG